MAFPRHQRLREQPLLLGHLLHHEELLSAEGEEGRDPADRSGIREERK